MYNYIAYRRAYPTSPGSEAFLPLGTGPERGQAFTDDQEDVLLYAIAVRTRFMRSAMEKVRDRTLPFSTLEVYRFAKSVFDRIGQPFPAYNTVLKFVNRVKEREPELFAYMQRGPQEGRRFADGELLPKRKNDVSGPNKRWQTDVKESKTYVEQNGKRYTFAIVLIYDDFSRYIVYIKLFLKEAKPDGSGMKGVTTRVWTTAVATAMYQTGTRPNIFYYDHGTYYIAADGSLQQLVEEEEPDMKTTKSKPGRPEGRGKIENVFLQFEAMLDRMAGHYKDRAGINNAKKDDDPYSFEEAEKEFQKKKNEWNNVPHRKNGKKTRFQVWTKEMAPKRPLVRQLAQLRDIEYEYKPITFRQDYNWALQFKSQEWEPRVVNAKINTLWARAVAGQVTVPMWAVKLDTGWVAEVCLDEQEELWVEIVLKGSDPHDEEVHNKELGRSLSDLEVRRKVFAHGGKETLMRLLGGLPVGEASSGEYTGVLEGGRLPKPPKQKSNADEQATAQPASSAQGESEIEAERDDDQANAQINETLSTGYAEMYQRLKARLHKED